MTNEKNSVVIAGAGPVGLVTALVLARAGIFVKVFEKRDTLSRASKASTFHPPTLEILNQLEVADAALSAGQVVKHTQYRDRNYRVLAQFDLSVLNNETRFPFRLHYEQAQLTQIIVEALGEFPNAEVTFGAEVVAAESSDSEVRVGVQSASGRENVVAAYLFGADGAHSAVRESLGIEFDIKPYKTRVLRIMTSQDMNTVISGVAPLTYIFGEEQSCSLLQMPDCWRIILRIPAEIPDELALDMDWYSKELGKFFSPQDLHDSNIISADVFSVSKALASTNRVGRTFLVGDSVHLTNTRGGMNMNCGIHDAYAIGNALIDSLRDGSMSALDKRIDERLNIAREELIPRTDHRVTSAEEWLREVQEYASDENKARAFLRSASMLDIAPPMETRAV